MKEIDAKIPLKECIADLEVKTKIIILEDIDKDGRADKSTVFADDLHIPLSFELGDGGVYVSEEPFMSWIGDTDGAGKAV